MGKIRKLFIGIIFFFYIYEIRFKGIPTIFSTRKVTLIILIILSLVKYKDTPTLVFRMPMAKYKTASIYNKYVLGIIIVLGHSFILALALNRMDEGYVDAKYLSFFLLYAVIAPYFFCELFDNIEDLFRTIAFIGVIQSTVIYMLAFFYDLRVLLDGFLETETKLGYAAQNVKVYGLGAWGANGSVLLFLSLYSIGYLIIKNRHILLNVLMYIYILTATVMVGRTGFYLGVLLGGMLIIRNVKRRVKKSVFIQWSMVVCLLLAVFVFGMKIVTNYTNIHERVITTISHLDKSTIFNRNGPSFVNSMLNMTLPEFSVEVFYGSGHGRGISLTGINVQNDIGYVQRFYALGIFMAVWFYLTIYSTFVSFGKRIADKADRKYYFLLIVFLFVLEFKEQFIFYYIIPAIIIMAGFIYMKQQNKTNVIRKANIEKYGIS